MMFGIEYNLI